MSLTKAASNSSILYYKDEVITSPTVLLEYYLNEFYGIDIRVAGVIAGVAVFLFSIFISVGLLYQSGSFEKLIEENKRAQELQEHESLLQTMLSLTGKGWNKSSLSKKEKSENNGGTTVISAIQNSMDHLNSNMYGAHIV